MREKDLARYAEVRQFPIVPCDLCGSQETLQRKQMKEMIGQWEKQHPGRIESMMRSLTDIRPSHLLDRSRYDFVGLKPSGQADPEGDVVFDRDSQEVAQPAVITLHRQDAA